VGGGRIEEEKEVKREESDRGDQKVEKENREVRGGQGRKGSGYLKIRGVERKKNQGKGRDLGGEP